MLIVDIEWLIKFTMLIVDIFLKWLIKIECLMHLIILAIRYLLEYVIIDYQEQNGRCCNLVFILK